MASSDFETKLDTIGQEIISLREKAGISEKVDRLESYYEPDYFRDRELAPFGTDQRKRQMEERESSDWVSYRNALRHLYFSIEDVETRRALIASEREFRKVRMQSFVSDLSDSRKRMLEAESTSISGFGNAISCAVLVVIGASIGGVVGALVASVIAIMIGLYSFKNQQRQRDRNIEAAKANAEAAAESLAREESKEQEFSYDEEISGRPE